MTYIPKAGDEVYSTHGDAAIYIGKFAGYHYVAPIYETESGEPCYGSPERWVDVHEKPPIAKKTARIAELDAIIAERTAELNRVNQDIYEAGRRRAEQLKKLSQHKALSRIEDFIDGKFTLFLVVPDYGTPYVETAEEALKNGGTEDENRWAKAPTKLLTLFGSSNGDLQWRINRYNDGSGSSNKNVYPCHDEQEAAEILRELYAKAVEEWRGRKPDHRHYGHAVTWPGAVPYEIDVPQDVADYIAEAKRQADLKARQRAMEEIAQAEKILADLKARAA